MGLLSQGHLFLVGFLDLLSLLLYFFCFLFVYRFSNILMVHNDMGCTTQVVMDCWWEFIAVSQGTMRSCKIKNFKAPQWSSESHQNIEDRGVTPRCYQEGCKGSCPCWLFGKGHEVRLPWWVRWGCFEVMEHPFISPWEVSGASFTY